jgi:hypothetical protein
MEKNYYIYIYLNPLNPGIFKYEDLEFDFEPIYIGKGINNRSHNHLTSCQNKKNKSGYRRLFYQKLRKIIRLGKKPKIIFFKEHLSEKEAFQLEIELVSKIGRRIAKEGPLCNNSKGGEGPSGAIAPRYSVCVYDSNGIIVSIETSVKECAKKYEIPEITIYKHLYKTRVLPTKGFYFRKESDEILNLNELENRKSGTPKNKEFIKICQYDLEGNFIQEFKNLSEAVKITKVAKDTIRNSLLGHVKKPKKFIFKIKN